MEEVVGDIGITFFVLALARTLLVMDGVLDFHGYGSMVYRISSCLRRITSSSRREEVEVVGAAAIAPRSSGNESPRRFRWVSNSPSAWSVKRWTEGLW